MPTYIKIDSSRNSVFNILNKYDTFSVGILYFQISYKYRSPSGSISFKQQEDDPEGFLRNYL